MKEENRTCKTCGHLYYVVNVWCGSEEAIADRGTRVPGCINCPYWKPQEIDPLTVWERQYTVEGRFEEWITKKKQEIKSFTKSVLKALNL